MKPSGSTSFSLPTATGSNRGRCPELPEGAAPSTSPTDFPKRLLSTSTRLHLSRSTRGRCPIAFIIISSSLD
ncbi:actin-related protein 4 isoform X1 [Iris pallida]|uniref:Actin-related protein 4 isoform X1 n=1 Tax=Iris pallida TaxID=29817 RepID=A0AAX6DKT1_IRIPA|nr:actin-related protein 4 isoform X1 [Iris pallida]